MKPVSFPEENAKLQPPPDLPGCVELPVWIDTTCKPPMIQSEWELDEDERAAIAAGSRIVLTIWGSRHPPVAVGVVRR